MRCPFCGAGETRVVDSRLGSEGNSVRRRRECGACRSRFTTHEPFEASYPQIIKSDGARQPYDGAKLRAGIERALEKRPVSTESVDDMISRIERRLIAHGERECASRELGSWVMDELEELDQVAYVRFASVYRSFEDLDAFRETVDRLRPRHRRVRR